MFKVKRFKTVLGRLGYDGAHKTSENTFLTTQCNVQNDFVFKNVGLLNSKASFLEETREAT
jgi:hypothetical protein